MSTSRERGHMAGGSSINSQNEGCGTCCRLACCPAYVQEKVIRGAQDVLRSGYGKGLVEG